MMKTLYIKKTKMDLLREKLIELLSKSQLEVNLIPILADITLLVSLLIGSVIFYFIIKMTFNLTVKKVGLKSKSKFIVALLESPLIPNVLKLIPALFFD